MTTRYEKPPPPERQTTDLLNTLRCIKAGAHSYGVTIRAVVKINTELYAYWRENLPELPHWVEVEHESDLIRGAFVIDVTTG